MKKILITGASGLVGSHLLPLLQPDHEIHVLGRGQPPEGAGEGIRHHAADLSRGIDESSLPDKIDAVIYLAQSENFRNFPEKARDVFDVNVASLLHLLDYARRAGATSFVSASSGGVYGAATEAVTEDVSISANGSLGFYLSTKLCGEILVENYAPYMNVAILRLFFAYGRGQKRSMLVPRLVDNIRAGTPVTLQGKDGIRINPIHAGDAAAAVKAALSLRSSAKINVAGPEILSMREICTLIGTKVGREPHFSIAPNSPHGDLIADIARMEELLSVPQCRLHDGIDELL